MVNIYRVLASGRNPTEKDGTPIRCPGQAGLAVATFTAGPATFEPALEVPLLGFQSMVFQGISPNLEDPSG